MRIAFWTKASGTENQRCKVELELGRVDCLSCSVGLRCDGLRSKTIGHCLNASTAGLQCIAGL
jgi:hypothetical protein